MPLTSRLELIVGALVLGGAWLGPLPELARHAFSAHMALHMAVVAVAAPLVAAGLAGTRLDPVRPWPRWFAPLPAAFVELLVVWGWHAPGVHHLARAHTGWLVLEQASFLLAGLLLWLSALGGGARRRRERLGPGIAGLLVTSMHMTLLGALLALAWRPLYRGDAAVTFLGLSRLADQQLGGAIMLVVGGVVYLAGGLWLTAALVREVPARSLERT